MPYSKFYLQTGFLKAGNLILMKKLNMYHHLSNLPEESLGRIILDIQVSKDLPGLHRELKEHLDRISVEDIHMIPKSVWKRKVKDYITEINQRELLDDIRRSKKLDFEKMSKESFERKKYFFSMNLESVRMKFRISSHMVQTVRKNFRRRYQNVSLTCPSCKDSPLMIDMEVSSSQGEDFHPSGSFCQQISDDEMKSSSKPTDTQNHLLHHCPTFRNARIGKNMLDDQQVVDFFREVLEYRRENDQI